jgi:hypothetical protein
MWTLELISNGKDGGLSRMSSIDSISSSIFTKIWTSVKENNDLKN